MDVYGAIRINFYFYGFFLFFIFIECHEKSIRIIVCIPKHLKYKKKRKHIIGLIFHQIELISINVCLLGLQLCKFILFI